MMPFFQPRFFSGPHHTEGCLCRHNYGIRILLLPWQTLIVQAGSDEATSPEIIGFPLHVSRGSQNPVHWLPKSKADLSDSRCVPVEAFFTTLRWKVRPTLLPSPKKSLPFINLRLPHVALHTLIIGNDSETWKWFLVISFENCNTFSGVLFLSYLDILDMTYSVLSCAYISTYILLF